MPVTLNSINIDCKIYSKKFFLDKSGRSYCIVRVKVINTHKGKVTDVNLLDCFAYNDCCEMLKKELNRDDFIRVTGKLQKRNTKDWTVKVNKIKKINLEDK